MQCQGPNCTKEVEQLPGGHRARKYCSDICRVGAHRKHAEAVKDAQRKIDATANVQKMWDNLSTQYDDLLPDQLALLHFLNKKQQNLEKQVGQALMKVFEFASASEQGRKDILVGNLMCIGEELGYPELEGIPEGNDNWWRYLRPLRLEKLRPLYDTVYYRYWSPSQEADELERLRRADGSYAHPL